MAHDAAIAAWRHALGTDAVDTDPAALARMSVDTSDHAVPPVAILRPADVAGVVDALRIATETGVPLHPVSSGRNWGYGSANAYAAGCATLDLARLAAIRHFDPDLGLVTLEPGVTQGALRAWLDRHGHDFMVPTTGAGPTCSLVGNALERGYGLTPFADHFAAVIGIEAVLADGRLYRSPLGTGAASGGFKWGIGPYLDGVFAQGNAGVVTAMTLALVRRPEVVETFYAWFDRDDALEPAVDAVRAALRQAGANLGGINLISAARFLAMSADGGDAPATRDRAATEAAARDAGAAAWMGFGAIYGTHAHAAATRRVVRETLGRAARRVVFVSATKARRLERLVGWLPGARARKLQRTATVMRQGLDLLEGRPGEVALPLAYTGSGRAPVDDAPRNPAADGCGLLWYAPIVAMRADDARRFVTLAREVCAAHGFDAPVTLSSLSDRSFDCTLPLLFDREDPTACAAADACWRALFDAGHAQGFLPYRVPGRYASLQRDDANGFWSLLDDVKQAVDPRGVVSPGRWEAR